MIIPLNNICSIFIFALVNIDHLSTKGFNYKFIWPLQSFLNFESLPSLTIICFFNQLCAIHIWLIGNSYYFFTELRMERNGVVLMKDNLKMLIGSIVIIVNKQSAVITAILTDIYNFSRCNFRPNAYISLVTDKLFHWDYNIIWNGWLK